MKRLIPLFLSLLLLAACGDKAASSSSKDPSSGGGLVTSQPKDAPDDPAPDEGTDIPSVPDKEDTDASGDPNGDTDAPDDSDEGSDTPGGNAASQVDVALVREIVFTYGAEEDTLNQPGIIVTKKKSFFYRTESWSGENGLAPSDYLSWVDSQPVTDDERAAIDAGQQYAEGRSIGGLSSRYIGPEEMITSRFEVTLEHLRSDPEYYDGSIPGYFLMAGGGRGARPTVSFTFQQDGDILTVPVTLTFLDGSEPETTHTLTVRLEVDGGWKYLGCQVS